MFFFLLEGMHFSVALMVFTPVLIQIVRISTKETIFILESYLPRTKDNVQNAVPKFMSY